MLSTSKKSANGSRTVARRAWQPSMVLVVLILFAFAEMSALSIARYKGFNVKYFDLGAMSQSVWSVTQGKPLIFTGQGIELSRLSRNVELIYIALAPLYALFPTPVTLLLIQAGLYALGAVPLFRLAQRKLAHSWLALAVTAIYLFYPAVQTAVLAEFHSDPLALPFLLFAIEAADRSAWRNYTVWILLALTCKFYIAAPVMALGLVLWLQGERRVGLGTVLLAAVWGLVAFFGVRTLFAPPPADAALAVNVQASAAGYFFNRFQLGFVLDTIVIRLVHAVIVLMPALLVLGWRAPLWLLPAAAVVVPALLSNGFGPSFSYRTHHYALAVPFLVTAVLLGAAKQRNNLLPAPENHLNKRPYWQGRILLTLFMVLVFNLAFIDTPVSPQFYLDRPEMEYGLSSIRFGVIERDRFKESWLATHVPDHVPVAADQLSATRLVNRETLYLTNYVFGRPLAELLPDVDIVVTDALYDWFLADPQNPERVLDANVLYEHTTIKMLLENEQFGLTAVQDGLLLFTRGGPDLPQSVTFRSDDSGPTLAEFGNQIGLVDAEIEQLSAGRLRLRLDWRLLQPWPEGEAWLAVSRLGQTAQTRIVHLPVTTLAPPSTWPEGRVVQESFEITLPPDLPSGEHEIWIGWYDAQNSFAAHTDERSRIGDEVLIGVINIR